MDKATLVRKLNLLVDLAKHVNSFGIDDVDIRDKQIRDELVDKAIAYYAEDIVTSAMDVPLSKTHEVTGPKNYIIDASGHVIPEPINVAKEVKKTSLNIYEDTGIIEIDLDNKELSNETMMAGSITVKDIRDAVANNKIDKMIRMEGLKNLNKILKKEGKSISNLFTLNCISDMCEKSGMVPEGRPGTQKYRGTVVKNILPTKEWQESEKFKKLKIAREKRNATKKASKITGSSSPKKPVQKASPRT